MPGVEIITRSHVYLLDAVNRLLGDDPVARSRLEVHFAGVMSDTDTEIADACPASRRHGYVRMPSPRARPQRRPAVSPDAEAADRHARRNRSRQDLRISRLEPPDPRRPARW